MFHKIMIFQNNNIALWLEKHKIETRPNAGQGLWLMLLLPLALIISAAAHPVISTPMYKLSSIFSVGLICSSWVFLYGSSRNKRLNFLNIWLLVACFITAILFHLCLHRGLLFSVCSAIVSTICYNKLYLLFLKKLPRCFTLGEASIFSQSYILLLYFTVLNIFNYVMKPATSVMQMSTLTVQIGLFGLSIILFLTYQFSIRSPSKFYVLTALIFTFIILVPLQILLQINPLLWIVNLFWEDIQRSRVTLYWAVFSTMAIAVVNLRIKKAKKATTVVRKIFHFLITGVFIPGLLYNCSLLYLASGVVLGIFFMLEILRLLNLPPLAETLQNGLVIFGDEKDCGIIALTPMYLLGGCALPIWIHPAPCDVTNSGVFHFLPLLSGVLTIGVGDTAASIVGSKFGTHYWKGSKKTVEGTIACVGSQLLVIFLFQYLGFIKLLSAIQYIRTVLAVVIVSIVEAKTKQIDNLVMPFLMYILLII